MRRKVLSPSAALNRLLPSAAKTMDQTPAVFAAHVPSNLPLATSHHFTVLSTLPEAKVLPSGLRASADTRSEWAASSTRTLWVFRFHSRIVLSSPLEISVVPSRLSNRLPTCPVCPLNGGSISPGGRRVILTIGFSP